MEMNVESIFEKVKEIIENATGYPGEDINLDDTLFNKLGVDSIDLVDILYELEMEFDVSLKISLIENRLKTGDDNKPYEVNGIITPEGLESLKEFMTEIDPKDFVPGLTVHELVQLFTVHSLCKMVLAQISEKPEE